MPTRSPSRSARREMLSAALTAAALVALALFSAACGGSADEAPGELEPKRAVDPRTEVLRFYPADAGAVVLVEVADPKRLRQLDRGMSEIAGWSEAREFLAAELSRAGIDPEQVLDLSRSPGAELDLPAPEIAAGPIEAARVGSEGPITAAEIMFALATDRGARLDRLFREATGDLTGAGTFEGARLYRGESLDFAVRDGVLLAGPSVGRLQQALTRRDGDREAQLDEAAVQGLFSAFVDGDGETSGYPFHAYLGEEPDAVALWGAIVPELELGEGGDGWVEMTAAALGIDPGGSRESTSDGDDAAGAEDGGIEGDDRDGGTGPKGALVVELVSELREPLEAPVELERADEDSPLTLTVEREAIDEALESRPALASALDGLADLAPVEAEIWTEGDRLRARLTSGR